RSFSVIPILISSTQILYNLSRICEDCLIMLISSSSFILLIVKNRSGSHTKFFLLTLELIVLIVLKSLQSEQALVLYSEGYNDSIKPSPRLVGITSQSCDSVSALATSR